jgi:hypothetical protein
MNTALNRTIYGLLTSEESRLFIKSNDSDYEVFTAGFGWKVHNGHFTKCNVYRLRIQPNKFYRVGKIKGNGEFSASTQLGQWIDLNDPNIKFIRLPKFSEEPKTFTASPDITPRTIALILLLDLLRGNS